MQISRKMPHYLLSFLLFSLCWLSPAQAETLSFRNTTTLQVPTEADRELGIYLASLLSMRDVLNQATTTLKTQAFAQGLNYTDFEWQALALTLIKDKLQYVSEINQNNPLQVVYNAKFSYDTLIFPENSDAVYQNLFGQTTMSQYLILQNQENETRLQRYFEKIKLAQDPALRQMLHEQETPSLLTQYHISQSLDMAGEYIRLKKNDQARPVLEKSLQMDPDNRVVALSLAMLLMDQKDYDGALTRITEQLKFYPNDEKLYVMRGFFYFSQKVVIQKGLDDLETAARLNPNQPFVHLLLGIFYKNRGNNIEATKHFAKACALGFKAACKY